MPLPHFHGGGIKKYFRKIKIKRLFNL